MKVFLQFSCIYRVFLRSLQRCCECNGLLLTLMKGEMNIRLLAFLLCGFFTVMHVDAQMKTWWFFGYERTTNEGIVADIDALHDAGFGGVVYYDQNHAKVASALGADDGFSSDWWQHLRFAAEETRKRGMTFEINISNGYVAGGCWIDPRHAMQRVASADTVVNGGVWLNIPLPTIAGREGYVDDIALMAFPVKDTDSIRHFSARYLPKGKGRNGAMQIPGRSAEFMGAKFERLPDIGVLQWSDDSVSWHDVVAIENLYNSQGAYPVRTTSFPATRGKYWHVNYFGEARLRDWHVGPEALLDRWEEKSGLHCDFDDYPVLPVYDCQTVVLPDEIVDLRRYVGADGMIRWEVPKGQWHIVRFSAVLTGARSKHGRVNLLGYECDKLSREAAELHWNSYAQVIIDSLNAGADGIPLVSGVTMDSHEGGSQNWTPRMLEEFEARRGYDLMRYFPVMAGYIVESLSRTEQVLRDLRMTINDCMRDNYYGTFQRKATENNLHFTAQAIGNALCIPGDAIGVKSAVEKPQGEFWTYQQTGAYDVKDCSSAAHLYGKSIASAEAMTDAEYKDSPLDIKRVADIAFAMGAQEFVVCATPHIPTVDACRYVAGREYAINRSNPLWGDLKPVWRQINESMDMLRRGKAAPDVLIFLGDDLPVKTLTHKLPEGIEDLDWDVCTGDALLRRIEATPEGLLTTPDSVTYKALIIEEGIYISPESQRKIDSLRGMGVKVLYEGTEIVRPLNIIEGKDAVVHTHRIIDGKDVFFVANVTVEDVRVRYSFYDETGVHEVWLKAGESRFLACP